MEAAVVLKELETGETIRGIVNIDQQLRDVQNGEGEKWYVHQRILGMEHIKAIYLAKRSTYNVAWKAQMAENKSFFFQELRHTPARYKIKI